MITSRSWSKGLKRKSGLYEALEQIIREVETKMRGGRVCSLGTDCSDVPHVVEIRSDNAKENIVKRMRELCARNGTRMEGSLCHVVISDDLVRAKGKKSFKAVVIGYAEEREPAQKGYVVRRLSDGWVTTGTYAQAYV
jgi:hypothetical protein